MFCHSACGGIENSSCLQTRQRRDVRDSASIGTTSKTLSRFRKAPYREDAV